MEEKIKKVGDIIDNLVDFVAISKRFKGWFKTLVATFEMFDGYLFRSMLTQIIKFVPEDKKYVVENYLDAVIANKWEVAVEGTSEFVNTLIDIPGASEDEELAAISANLVVMVQYAKYQMAKLIKKEAA